jgi:hypothetical protein
VGRRTNYGFEKRQRELKKQKKKEAKAERKRLKKEGQGGELDGDGPAEDFGQVEGDSARESSERGQEL